MSVQDLRDMLDEFDRTPAASGYELRLGLATIVLGRLDALGWTQKRLADATGMKESFVSRVIHGDQNCTFDVAGRLLFALGVRARLAEVPSSSRRPSRGSSARPAAARNARNGAARPRKRAEGAVGRRAAG
jgi:transcriptional regulator with XRE-family HTH domain